MELSRIENEEDRLVSFSKRRAGIYKKASEISILCGAQVGIIIFSPSDKPFTYGTPNIEAVVNRYSGRQDRPVVDLAATAFEAQHNAKVQEINNMHNELATRRDILKKEATRLTNIIKPIQKDFWWEAPLETLTPQQLGQLVESMTLLKKVAIEKEQEFMDIDSPHHPTNIATSSSSKNETILDPTNIASSSNQ
ncbi:Agamous-like MADS-box protein AGL62 [Bienertia sinuspersici]